MTKKTTAERQADYRARRNDGEGDRRLNTWISCRAHFALDRLASHHNISKRELLERLIVSTDEAILKTLEIDTTEWNDYLKVTA